MKPCRQRRGRTFCVPVRKRERSNVRNGSDYGRRHERRKRRRGESEKRGNGRREREESGRRGSEERGRGCGGGLAPDHGQEVGTAGADDTHIVIIL